RARHRLADARPVALLEPRLAVDVRFRPLQTETIERGGLSQHRRGAEDPGVDGVALTRGESRLLDLPHLIENAGVLFCFWMRGDVRGQRGLAFLPRVDDAEVLESTQRPGVVLQNVVVALDAAGVRDLDGLVILADLAKD